MKLIGSVGVILAALLLAACAGGTIPAGEGAGDVTADFKSSNSDAAWLDLVATVTRTETESLWVETTLETAPSVDDRPAAATALEICEAAAGMDGVSSVRVLRANHTSWMLYGVPGVPEGECGEG